MAAILAVCAVSIGIASAADDSPTPQTLSQQIEAEARRVLSHVKTTTYAHKSHVDEEQGLYELDCSGLVDLILKKVSPKLLAEVETRRGHKRQLADDYVQTFEESPDKAETDRRQMAADRASERRPARRHPGLEKSGPQNGRTHQHGPRDGDRRIAGRRAVDRRGKQTAARLIRVARDRQHGITARRRHPRRRPKRRRPRNALVGRRCRRQADRLPLEKPSRNAARGPRRNRPSRSRRLHSAIVAARPSLAVCASPIMPSHLAIAFHRNGVSQHDGQRR